MVIKISLESFDDEFERGIQWLLLQALVEGGVEFVVVLMNLPLSLVNEVEDHLTKAVVTVDSVWVRSLLFSDESVSMGVVFERPCPQSKAPKLLNSRLIIFVQVLSIIRSTLRNSTIFENRAHRIHSIASQ